MIELNLAHLIVAFTAAACITTAVIEVAVWKFKKELEKNRQLKNLKY